MTPNRFQNALFESTRGRIINILRREKRTVDDIAEELGVTGNAIRSQLAAMERDGVVRKGGTRRGVTRPSRTYELTPAVEELLSRAYIPLLTQLVQQFASHESPAKFDRMMREAGRGVARELAKEFPTGPLGVRVAAASHWLNGELGAVTEVRKTDSRYIIDGRSCPLAALTGK